MRSFGIGKKLFCCVMAMFALMVILSVVVHVSLTGMEEAHHRTVDKSARKLILINQIDTAKSDLLAAQRGLFQRMWFKEYDLAEAARKSFQKNVELVQRYLEEMRSLGPTPEEAKLVEKLQAQTQAWPGKFAETNRLLVAGKAEEAKEYTHNVPMFVGTEQTVSEFKKLEIALLEQEKQKASRQAAISRYLAWGMSSISLVMGVLFFLMIHRMTGKLNGFTQQLSESSSQIVSSAAQVSASSQALAQGASEQAASLEETSSSTEEITSMTRQNTENANGAARLVDDSGRQFESANQKLGEMVTAMKEISSASNQVAKIIKVIDEIAFQTNILALNAAVEAARAGEAGMGFAVVADEVRNLAQRCATAARDTQGLIETAVSKSTNGMQKVQDVEQAITVATKQALEIKTLVDEVNVGSQEQKKGLEQISGAIQQMEQVTQKAATNAEESAAAGQELNTQADTLLGLVKGLNELVTGGSGTAVLHHDTAR